MASHISGLLSALKQWRKAINKLGKKRDNPLTRKKRLDQAREHVLAYLAAEPVTVDMDELIQQAIAPASLSAESLRTILVKHPEPIVSIELKTIHPLAASQKDLEKVVYTFLRTPDDDKPIADSQELHAIFTQLSEVIPQEYQATNRLSRKQKKRRRRDLTLGTLHTVLGVGLLAGNTQLDLISADVSYIANASYILGGNALINSMKNLIGQLDNNGASDD